MPSFTHIHDWGIHSHAPQVQDGPAHSNGEEFIFDQLSSENAGFDLRNSEKHGHPKMRHLIGGCLMEPEWPEDDEDPLPSVLK